MAQILKILSKHIAPFFGGKLKLRNDGIKYTAKLETFTSFSLKSLGEIRKKKF